MTAQNQGQNQNASNLGPLPFGQIPAGATPMSVRVQHQAQFPPELAAALRKARDASGGRWLVMVVDTGDEKGETLNSHITLGPGWKNDWWWRACQLFLSRMLKFEPTAVVDGGAVAAGGQQPAAPAAEVIDPVG